VRYQDCQANLALLTTDMPPKRTKQTALKSKRARDDSDDEEDKTAKKKLSKAATEKNSEAQGLKEVFIVVLTEMSMEYDHPTHEQIVQGIYNDSKQAHGAAHKIIKETWNWDDEEIANDDCYEQEDDDGEVTHKLHVFHIKKKGYFPDVGFLDNHYT
jgi:nuclear transport factor 2 (NTF2) superfamily protein